MSHASGLQRIRTRAATPLRRRALHGFQRVLQWTGAGAAYVRAGTDCGATILMYHSVPEPETAPWIDPRDALEPNVFRAQMEFLAARRRVVSLTELADALAAGVALPAGTVVLTFDDGYLDNLTVVAPILERLGLPAVLYLPTGYVTRGENQWVDRLYAAFRARSRSLLELEMPAGLQRWDLAHEDSACEAYAGLCAVLLVASWSEREALLGAVVEQLAPTVAAPRLMLTWEDVRALLRRHPRFELGGHSVDHTDLTGPDAASRLREVTACLDDIERETGERPAHFSYPYGRSDDAARDAVAASGCRTAVRAADSELVRTGSDPFALPRVESPRSHTLFRFWTSGAYPDLSRRLVGRA